MPTPQLAKQAEAVRADLVRLEADLKTLLNSVGGAIGDAISARINGPLSSIASHIEPLLSLLGATPSATIRRGPGRPKKVDGAATKRRGGRGAGRGKKVNLTPEVLREALQKTGGNKTAAAKALGVSQPTFYKYWRAVDGAAIAESATPKASATKKKTAK